MTTANTYLLLQSHEVYELFEHHELREVGLDLYGVQYERVLLVDHSMFRDLQSVHSTEYVQVLLLFLRIVFQVVFRVEVQRIIQLMRVLLR